MKPPYNGKTAKGKTAKLKSTNQISLAEEVYKGKGQRAKDKTQRKTNRGFARKFADILSLNTPEFFNIRVDP